MVILIFDSSCIINVHFVHVKPLNVQADLTTVLPELITRLQVKTKHVFQPYSKSGFCFIKFHRQIHQPEAGILLGGTASHTAEFGEMGHKPIKRLGARYFVEGIIFSKPSLFFIYFNEHVMSSFISWLSAKFGENYEKFICERIELIEALERWTTELGAISSTLSARLLGEETDSNMGADEEEQGAPLSRLRASRLYDLTLADFASLSTTRRKFHILPVDG